MHKQVRTISSFYMLTRSKIAWISVTLAIVVAAAAFVRACFIHENPQDTRAEQAYPAKIVNSSFDYPEIDLADVSRNRAIQLCATDGRYMVSCMPYSIIQIDDWDQSKFAWTSDGSLNESNEWEAVWSNNIELQQQSEQREDGTYNVYCEIVANEPGKSIYQDVKTVPNSLYKWKLDHCSIYSFHDDTMQVLIGPQDDLEPQLARRVTQNKDKVNPITPEDEQGSYYIQTACPSKMNEGYDANPDFYEARHYLNGYWETYVGEYECPADQEITRFTFLALDNTSSEPENENAVTTYGNLIDNVSFARFDPLIYDLRGGHSETICTTIEKAQERHYAGYFEDATKIEPTNDIPTREGYAFLGWSESPIADATDETSYDEASKNVIKNHYMQDGHNTLYAVWAKNPELSYVSADEPDRIIETRSISPGSAPEFPIISTNAGYHAEWSPNADSVWEDTTFSYSIVLNSYRVSFDGNGATGRMESMETRYDDAIIIPASSFEKRGYYFVGWNTQEDGSGEAFSAGDEAMMLSDGHEDEVVLYAQWEISKEELEIDAKANLDEFGSVTVSWLTYDYFDKNFKVYQQSGDADPNDDSAWNSVGIDYRDVEEVRCLQIYPLTEAKGQLKRWLETPVEGVVGAEKGYGKGIISVDEMPLEEFNSNTRDKLIDPVTKNYKYDVIFFGTWDNNGGQYNDMSDGAADEVLRFIRAGRGVVFGHDTVKDERKKNFWRCRVAVGVYSGAVRINSNGEYYYPSELIFSGAQSVPHFIPTQDLFSKVQITQKGLLTNYPWEIGDVGGFLEVPATHNAQATDTGNIWLKFYDDAYDDAEMASNYNFYLVTKNNCAMIQTGHCDGRATKDEQKILANTIFYVNQLIFDTCTLRDASAQDTAKPVISAASMSDDKSSIKVGAIDLGNDYRYKVESYSKEDTTPEGKISTSADKLVNVTTGVKDYYVVCDDSPATRISSVKGFSPTKQEISDDGSIALDHNGAYGKYAHIVAVDGAGNISDTETIKIPNRFELAIVDGITKEVVDTRYVFEGCDIDIEDITAGLPTHNGYAFDRFSKELDTIESDTTVEAIYAQNPLVIEATSDASGYGSAIVSWPDYDYLDKNFKVYQSSDKETWNSVGIDYTSVTDVRVLNIYPTKTRGSSIAEPIEETITFYSQKDEREYTILKSASLKRWMEEATPEAPLGYGKGIIGVTPVDIDTFNASPEKYCDLSKYDVILFGTWDYNGGAGFTEESIRYIEKWIKSGKGFIAGHDSFTGIDRQNHEDFNSYWINTLSWKYFKLKSGADLFENPPDSDYAATKSTRAFILKQGLLTNYPWNIGNVGDELSIPEVHNNSVISYATNWINFNTFETGDVLGDGGSNNYYVATNLNCAHIQTGHSSCEATPDEQKMLANLCFYLNQLCFEKGELRDASAQDTASPEILSHSFKLFSGNSFAIDSMDNGSTYYYRAESYKKEDTTKETGLITESQNIAEANVTTGVSCYKVIFDDNAETMITNANIDACESYDVFKTGNVIDFSAHAESTYAHVVAVDGAGNISDTHHVPLPVNMPATGVIGVGLIVVCGFVLVGAMIAFFLRKSPE